MGGGSIGDDDAAASTPAYQSLSNDIEWTVQTMAPGAPPGLAKGFCVTTERDHWVARYRPGEHPIAIYVAGQIDAAAVATPTGPPSGQPGSDERRALALFVGSGYLVVTSHRLLAVLLEGSSLRGPFHHTGGRLLVASLPHDRIWRLSAAGSGPDHESRVDLLVESVGDAALDVRIDRQLLDDGSPIAVGPRELFETAVSVIGTHRRSIGRLPGSSATEPAAPRRPEHPDELVVTFP